MRARLRTSPATLIGCSAARILDLGAPNIRPADTTPRHAPRGEPYEGCALSATPRRAPTILEFTRTTPCPAPDRGPCRYGAPIGPAAELPLAPPKPPLATLASRRAHLNASVEQSPVSF